MNRDDVLESILSDSNYHLSLFSDDEIECLRESVVCKERRGKTAPVINCAIRKKEIQLKPEEVVRQLYANRLMNQYNYPGSRIALRDT